MMAFCDFNESYLESGNAPISHLTNTTYLYDILRTDVLKRGWVENPFFGERMKIVSFTRNPGMRLNFKPDSDVVIKLDKDKMIKDGHRFYPYDFFIQDGKETKGKGDPDRKQPFEFEECCTKDVNNVTEYILSVDFTSESFLEPLALVNIKLLRGKNIIVERDGVRI